ASSTTPIASIWPARACASGPLHPETDVRAEGRLAAPSARRPWITAGCATAQWKARSARRYPPPPQPLFASRAFSSFLQRPEPRPLDPSGQAKHHPIDPRKQTPGGRHQIGTPAGFKSESVAGFKSESVAGFLSECMAGFVGIRKDAEDFERIGEIGADDDLAEPVIRRGSRPAFGRPAGSLGRCVACRL